jgi:hypothetical protein
MALSLAAIVSFKPETSTPANLLSFAEQEATRQLRRLSAAPHRGPVVGSAPCVCGIDMPTAIANHVSTARGSSATSSRGCFQKFISVPSYRSGQEDAMAQEPLATKGNFLHIYDFRVTKGKEEEFVRSFEKFDYSDGNPMHKSWAQVKDGVLCRDTQDPQRFFLIAEWSDIEEHARIRKVLANEIKPEFIKYIEGGTFIPKYVEVVSSTPDEILNKAAAAE